MRFFCNATLFLGRKDGVSHSFEFTDWDSGRGDSKPTTWALRGLSAAKKRTRVRRDLGKRHGNPYQASAARCLKVKDAQTTSIDGSISI